MSSTADRVDLISEVDGHLRGVAKAVRRAMLGEMPDGEPVQWLYGPMREYPSRRGKALRPALCLSASRVFGAEPDAVIGIAFDSIRAVQPRLSRRRRRYRRWQTRWWRRAI